MSDDDLYAIVVRKGFALDGRTLVQVRADGLSKADYDDSASVADKETARAYLVTVLARIGCLAADHAKGDDDLPRGGIVACAGMLDVPEDRDDPTDELYEAYNPYLVGLYLHVPTRQADAWVKRLARWLELINAEQAGA